MPAMGGAGVTRLDPVEGAKPVFGGNAEAGLADVKLSGAFAVAALDAEMPVLQRDIGALGDALGDPQPMARVDSQVDAGRLGLSPQRESPGPAARRCLPRYSMRFMRLGSSELDMETGYTMRAGALKGSGSTKSPVDTES